MNKLAIIVLMALLACTALQASNLGNPWQVYSISPGYNPQINHQYGFTEAGDGTLLAAGNGWSKVSFVGRDTTGAWSLVNKSNITKNLGGNTLLATMTDGSVVCVSKDGSGEIYFTYDTTTRTWSSAAQMPRAAGVPGPYQPLTMFSTGSTLQDLHIAANTYSDSDTYMYYYWDGSALQGEQIRPLDPGSQRNAYSTCGVGHTMRMSPDGQLQAIYYDTANYANMRMILSTRTGPDTWVAEDVPGTGHSVSVMSRYKGYVYPAALAYYGGRTYVAYIRGEGNSTDGWCRLYLAVKDESGAWHTVLVDDDYLDWGSLSFRSMTLDLEISEQGVMAIAASELRYAAVSDDEDARHRLRTWLADLTQTDVLTDPRFTTQSIMAYDPTVRGDWGGGVIGAGYRDPYIVFGDDGRTANVLFMSRNYSGRNTGFVASASVVPEPLTLTGLALGGLALLARRRRR